MQKTTQERYTKQLLGISFKQIVYTPETDSTARCDLSTIPKKNIYKRQKYNKALLILYPFRMLFDINTHDSKKNTHNKRKLK